MKTKSLKLLAGLFLLPLATACTASTVAVNGYPESVAEDDDIYYVAVIGKTFEPTKQDGDGFITSLNARGKVLAENAFPNVKLNAPKGALIEDDILYVADINRIVGIHLRTGMVVSTIDLSSTGTQFLNDLAEDDDFLYVSATDINKIFRINLKNGKFEELETSEPLNAPNGLDIEDDILYVAEYATDASGKPAGKIKAIPLVGTGKRPVSVVYDVPGQYDGLVIREEETLLGKETDYIYFSDWGSNGKSGSVKKLNLRTREAETVKTGPVNGPADFIIEDDKLWLPAMADKKIVIVNL